MKIDRRHFLFCGCGVAASTVCGARAMHASALQGPARREVTIGGRRVRTVDMHSHVFVQEAWPLVKDLPQVDRAMANLGNSPMAVGDRAALDRRFREMDRVGIDVHVISVHPSQFLYFTEPGLAARIVRMQNERIAELCAAHPDRFVGFGNVSLQQPDLAVEQMNYAVDKLDLRGFIVGANVNGGELASPEARSVLEAGGGAGHRRPDPPAGVRRYGEAAGRRRRARQQHRVSARHDDRAGAHHLRGAAGSVPRDQDRRRARRRLPGVVHRPIRQLQHAPGAVSEDDAQAERLPAGAAALFRFPGLHPQKPPPPGTPPAPRQSVLPATFFLFPHPPPPARPPLSHAPGKNPAHLPTNAAGRKSCRY